MGLSWKGEWLDVSRRWWGLNREFVLAWFFLFFGLCLLFSHERMHGERIMSLGSLACFLYYSHDGFRLCLRKVAIGTVSLVKV